MSFAYGDAYRLMDRALASSQGIKLKIATEAAAIAMRHRCYKARAADKRKTYQLEDGNPSKGHSPYDKIVIQISKEADGIYLYIRNSATTLDAMIEKAYDLESEEELDIKEF